MNSNDHRCSQCGSKMVQTGTEYQTAIYHCRSCGNNEYVQISVNENTDYLHKRSMILGRVRKGIIDWEVTQWDTLRNEIMDFTIAYHAARNDIYFHMAIIACLTKGFHDLDDRRYKECKRIFKITEKVYKRYCKNPSVVPEEMGTTGATEYEDYRQQYKKCRNEFRNTKLAWKLLFSVGKKIIPIPKI